MTNLRRVAAAAAAGAAISAISSRSAAAIYRQFSTGTDLKSFSQLPPKRKLNVMYESRKVLAEYLNVTRSLPYPYADYIARNSPRSLAEVVSEVPFSQSTPFAHSFQRFLRYHPINELEFFLESIGFDGELPDSVSPSHTYFISDYKHFKVASALAGVGFPWSKLGMLWKADCLVFETDPSELQRTIRDIKNVYGFNSVSLIAICLAFPRVLHEKMDGLLTDLKILFLDHDLLSHVDCDIDGVSALCVKIRLFYQWGCEVGMIGELLGRSRSIFVDYSKEELISRIDYFSKLGVAKDQVAMLLLSQPEIFGYDLESWMISVSSILRQFGLSKHDLKSLKQRYPHVFGRNRMANLPNVMRSLGLGEWFFSRMKDGCHILLGNPSITCSDDEDVDKNYIESLQKIEARKTKCYSLKRLEFLHSVGFGQNVFAIKALAQLKGSAYELQKRFDCLLNWGIEYPKVCSLVRFRSKILNQRENVLDEKIKFLCTEMGLSLQFLDVFPGYLIYNLERKIKPRFRLHKWLVEQGICKKEYSVSTMIAPSEREFVQRISRIHPPSAKKWLENSSKKNGADE
ncbi:transcription termination factor MTEF18, mitochondrial [Andrographis paniculata]|uniref:transcription termination factor MTEF18, mitochondrial n=1 Tax=Andrographis paniculata TaxID=175694 RepID=UPI0021E86187|nr:transcription termination factor MTEF18, mitochondrial [Andrographis paniculata]